MSFVDDVRSTVVATGTRCWTSRSNCDARRRRRISRLEFHDYSDTWVPWVWTTLVQDSQGKETFFYAMDQDVWCCARSDEHGQPGRSRVVAWYVGVLRRFEVQLLLDDSAGLL